MYGLSQNPDTNDYILVLVWSSENEKIDNLIQEMRFKINSYDDIVFEWIPYNQFNEIRKICINNFTTVYSAKWNDGPLYWNKQNEKYMRNSNKGVFLKCLHNSQNPIESLINKVRNIYV
jgi:hypothetical protein